MLRPKSQVPNSELYLHYGCDLLHSFPPPSGDRLPHALTYHAQPATKRPAPTFPPTLGAPRSLDPWDDAPLSRGATLSLVTRADNPLSTRRCRDGESWRGAWLSPLVYQPFSCPGCPSCSVSFLRGSTRLRLIGTAEGTAVHARLSVGGAGSGAGCAGLWLARWLTVDGGSFPSGYPVLISNCSLPQLHTQDTWGKWASILCSDALWWKFWQRLGNKGGACGSLMRMRLCFMLNIVDWNLSVWNRKTLLLAWIRPPIDCHIASNVSFSTRVV